MDYSKKQISKFICYSILWVFLVILSSCEEKSSKVQEVENLFGLEIITNKSHRNYSSGIVYKSINDSARLSNYLDIFIREFQKYPRSYFKNINLQKVILCDSLTIGKHKRAGYPDPDQKTLVLSLDSFEKRTPYLIHIMHHELHHCTEFTLYGSMFHRSEEWLHLNELSFSYGSGGGEAYTAEAEKVNWYWLTHPRKGFSNWYATLGQEEDRAELVALLMNKSRRDTLVSYCKTDTILRNKVKYLIKELNGLVETRSNYWEDILKEFPKD